MAVGGISLSVIASTEAGAATGVTVSTAKNTKVGTDPRQWQDRVHIEAKQH